MLERIQSESEHVTQQAATATLQDLVSETLQLQRALQELLDTYPEEHLPEGELRIQNRVLSPRWRYLVGVDHRPIDRRYREWAAWADRVRDYIKRLQRHFQLTDESNARIERLPLAAVIDLPATELVELLGLQANMLRRWSVVEEPKTGSTESEGPLPARQRRSVDKVHQEIVRVVSQFRGLKLSHQEICKSLDAKKIDTPRRTKWSHLSWLAAYKTREFRASVQRWLSGILAK